MRCGNDALAVQKQALDAGVDFLRIPSADPPFRIVGHGLRQETPRLRRKVPHSWKDSWSRQGAAAHTGKRNRGRARVVIAAAPIRGARHGQFHIIIIMSSLSFTPPVPGGRAGGHDSSQSDVPIRGGSRDLYLFRRVTAGPQGI